MKLPLFCVALSLSSATLAQSSSYYSEAGSYGTRRESDPPSYVRQGTGDNGVPSWLQLGADNRARVEFRDDDIRRPRAEGLDTPLLVRTRLYAGVQTGWAPLRFGAEFEDARRYNSDFAADDRDVNEHEFIQGWAELHWAELLGKDDRGNARPLSVRAGRMAFELLDRRLVARNEWRNTTNNFDGVRVSFGQEANDWQVQFLALRPINRLLNETDSANPNLLMTGVVAHWRAAAPALTLEPYYLRLEQDPAAANGFVQRDIRTTGLRWYGAGWGGFNYDIALTQQNGWQGTQRHRATGVTAEVGYTWREHAWQPRLSGFIGHASGDANPNDQESNRFDRLYGFARPWSANDYIIYENLDALKWRLELSPPGPLRVDAGYSLYWLASTRDRFNNLLSGAGNRDPQGQSGDLLGREFDVRARYAVNPRLDLTLGYAWFGNGGFVKQRQTAVLGASAHDSDFTYVEVNWRWW